MGTSRFIDSYQQIKIKKRRKGSRKSIWNLAMDKGPDGELATVAESFHEGVYENNINLNIRCDCDSDDVQNFGSITSRNEQARKGEIWGTDRGEDVISKYQCNKCGKIWNEIE